MAGDSHDVLVVAFRDDPSLLGALLVALTGRPLPGPVAVADSTVRLPKTVEVRPDIVARTGDGWVICEVQNQVDPPKGRRWPLAVGALYDTTRQMGDLVVVTASRRVARWARRVAHVAGPAGTSLCLSPLVLLLDETVTPLLLDPAQPELALCAAWAMRRRRGPAAVEVVERALEVTEVLPEPLRTAQIRAILSVLSKELRARLERQMINIENIPESPAVRRLRLRLEERGRVEGRAEGRVEGRAEGRTEGRAESLLFVLEQRGLPVTAEQRAHIEACRDPAQLEAWLARALTADSVASVLSAEADKPVSRKRSARKSARSARNG